MFFVEDTRFGLRQRETQRPPIVFLPKSGSAAPRLFFREDRANNCKAETRKMAPRKNKNSTPQLFH